MCPIVAKRLLLTDLIGGQVQVIFATPPGSIEYVGPASCGVWRSRASRWEALPDVPAVLTSCRAIEASGWQGVGAPKNTPTEIVEDSTRRSMQSSPIRR